MENLYRYLRAALLIVTVVPIIMFIAANNNWEGFLDDLLG